MKQFKSILNLFLSLIFLAISFYPCADSYAGVLVSPSTESAQVTSVQQADLDIHHDVCSPLCSCSCCAVSLTVADVITIIEFTPTIEILKAPIYRKETVIRMKYPIWQPPKIVA